MLLKSKEDKITESKVVLYRLLLDKKVNKLSAYEVDILYLLSKDEKVKEIIDKSK